MLSYSTSRACLSRHLVVATAHVDRRVLTCIRTWLRSTLHWQAQFSAVHLEFSRQTQRMCLSDYSRWLPYAMCIQTLVSWPREFKWDCWTKGFTSQFPTSQHRQPSCCDLISFLQHNTPAWLWKFALHSPTAEVVGAILNMVYGWFCHYYFYQSLSNYTLGLPDWDADGNAYKLPELEEDLWYVTFFSTFTKSTASTNKTICCHFG